MGDTINLRPYYGVAGSTINRISGLAASILASVLLVRISTRAEDAAERIALRVVPVILVTVFTVFSLEWTDINEERIISVVRIGRIARFNLVTVYWRDVVRAKAFRDIRPRIARLVITLRNGRTKVFRVSPASAGAECFDTIAKHFGERTSQGI